MTAAARQSGASPATQASRILPELLAGLDDGRKLGVLHIGQACGDTMAFFSQYACRLHIVDVFAELPLAQAEEGPTDYEGQWRDILALPPDARFDLCLFWDLFNFLPTEAITALVRVLTPHLWDDTVGHAFSVHNRATAVGNYIYGLHDGDNLSVRPRTRPCPGYAPHSQHALNQALQCFSVERSLLLADSRLELLLRVKVPGAS